MSCFCLLTPIIFEFQGFDEVLDRGYNRDSRVS